MQQEARGSGPFHFLHINSIRKAHESCLWEIQMCFLNEISFRDVCLSFL